MRFKFIMPSDPETSLAPELIGQEVQLPLKPVGHTIACGVRVASNGVLKPFVEDITKYDNEGLEIFPDPEPNQDKEN